MTHRPIRSLAGVCLVACALCLAGCPEGIGSFSITEESGEKIVEGNKVAATLGSALPGAFNFDINLERELEKRDAGPADSVEMEVFELRITETEMQGDDTDNFNFLSSMTIFVNAEGQSKKRVAWVEEVPQNVQTLDFEVDDDLNLKPYIEAGMNLEVEADGSPPPDDTSIKAFTELIVDVI